METRWWHEKDENRMAEAAAKELRAIRQDDARRQREDRLHAGLYAGAVVAGFSPMTYSRLSLPEDRLRWNVCRPVVDTAIAKIASKSPVRPMFLTNRGDWGLAQKAKRLERFTDGCFYEGRARVEVTRAWRDGGVFGTPIVKVVRSRDRVAYERVMPAHLVVDAGEAIEGRPPAIYQTRYVTKDRLIKLYPKRKDDIERAPAVAPDVLAWWGTGVGYNRTNVIEINEAWHPPTDMPVEKDKKHDGWYALCADTIPIDVKPWSRPWPFAIGRWGDPIQGFWGHGLLHDIRDVQREVNQTLQRCHEALRHAAIPRWHVEKGSGVEVSHLRGGEGAIADVVYRNAGFAAPVIQPGIAMPPEVYQWLREQYQRAFEIAGLSELSVQARKPSGLDSGVALRAFHDIETERFATVVRAFEEFHIELARRTLECAREIYEDRGTYTVRAANKRVVEEIDWKEVALDDDAYVMQVWPASTLPQTPAGKLEFITNARNALPGIFSEELTLRLMGWPDTETEFAVQTAPLDMVDRMVDRIMEDGDYTMPEPFLPLESSLNRVQKHYMRAEIDGVPEKRLELLRRLMRDFKTMIAKQPAPQLAPPATPGLTNGQPMAQTPVAA